MCKFGIIKFHIVSRVEWYQRCGGLTLSGQEAGLTATWQNSIGKAFAVSLASLPDVVRHKQVWYHSTPRDLENRISSNLCQTETIKPIRPRRNRFKQIRLKIKANPVEVDQNLWKQSRSGEAELASSKYTASLPIIQLIFQESSSSSKNSAQLPRNPCRSNKF